MLKNRIQICHRISRPGNNFICSINHEIGWISLRRKGTYISIRISTTFFYLPLKSLE